MGHGVARLRERTRVRPEDVIEIVATVAPLDARRLVEFTSSRLREAAERQRSALDARRVSHELC